MSMPVPSHQRRLLLGPPGTGLTAHVLEDLAHRLQDPATDPRRLLLVVPTVAAAESIQRRLQQRNDLPAFPDCVVPLDALPRHWGLIAPGRNLPPLIATLTLRQAMSTIAQRLEAAGQEVLLPPQRTGVLAAVRDQIDECKRAGYLPAPGLELRWDDPAAAGASIFPWALLEQTLAAQGAHRRLLLLDQFRHIWTAYEQLVHAPRALADGTAVPGWLDAADRLLLGADALEHRLPALDWLAVDGFTEFTALQWRILSPLLASRSDTYRPDITITLTVDRPEGALIEAEADPRAWVGGVLNDLGYFEVVRLAPPPGHPFPGLQTALLAITSGQAAPAEALHPWRELTLKRPFDRDREVASVLRDVVRQVQSTPNGRYREHLLIVRNLDVYRPLLQAEAAALGIPLRIFEKQPLAGHPLGQHWLRAVGLLEGDPWTHEAILGLLQPFAASPEAFAAFGQFQRWLAQQPPTLTPSDWVALLAGMPAEDAAGLEAGLEAMQQLLAGVAATDRLAVAIGWLTGALLPLWHGCPTPPDPETVAAVEALEQLAETLSLEADLLAGFSVREIVATALRESTYEPWDRRREVLRVASAERARDLEADHIAILGLTLGAWPRRPAPEPFFDDPLRMLLSERQRSSGADRQRRAGAWSRPDWKTEAATAAIEGFLFRLACGHARAQLTLSAPQTEQGKPVEPSPWLAALADANALETSLTTDDEGQRLVPLREWVHPGDAAAWLACYRHEGVTGQAHRQVATRHALGQLGRKADGPVTYGVALAEYLVAQPGIGIAVTQAASRWPNVVPRLEQPYPESVLRPSPSSLNDLAQCPFVFFAQRVCGLRELEADLGAGFDALQRGLIAHEALEVWARDYPDMPPAQLLPIFDGIWGRELRGRPEGLYFPVQRALRRKLEDFLTVEAEPTPWRRLRSHIEWQFGKDDDVALTLPDGTPFRFTGKIDRLDEVEFAGQRCLILMDYKSSKKSLKEKEKELADALAGDQSANGEEGASGSPVAVTLLQQDIQLPRYSAAATMRYEQPVLAAFHYPLGKPSARVQAFVPGTGSWRIADWSEIDLRVATAAEWEALLLALRTRLAELFAQLQAQVIGPNPLITGRCGAGRCAYARLCRYPDMPGRSRW